MSGTSWQPAPASQTAIDRADFVKRLFAVTLSVGVANQLSRIMFDTTTIVNHQFLWGPVLGKWQEILLVISSLAIVVLSWEGYLGAIQRLPLEDWQRFWLDIALVFTYLMLTLSSAAFDLWFSIHMIVFLEYLLWDIARSRLPDYVNRQQQRSEPLPRYEISMNITIVWLLYFIAIFSLKNWVSYFEGTVGFVAITIAAALGVILYRQDKEFRANWRWRRKILATGLPLATLVALAWFHVGKNGGP
jgi:hypothetical protein